MTGTTPEYGAGFCCDCGRTTVAGRILGHVDQSSGPGYTVILCPNCDLKPPKSRVRPYGRALA
ncbi:hypothetical protein GXW82_34605 [Streptacidiphilus sp. 4-A2]|nr:hypothetical protein [Streptacidiphilus sp. 4-A2]